MLYKDYQWLADLFIQSRNGFVRVNKIIIIIIIITITVLSIYNLHTSF